MQNELRVSPEDLSWQLLTNQDKAFVRSIIGSYLAKLLDEGINPIDNFSARAGHNLKPLDSNYDYKALPGQSFGYAEQRKVEKPKHRYWKTSNVNLPEDVIELKKATEMSYSFPSISKSKEEVRALIRAHLNDRITTGLNPLDDFHSRLGHNVSYDDSFLELKRLSGKFFGFSFIGENPSYFRWQALQPKPSKEVHNVWQKIELIIKGLAALRLVSLFGMEYLKTNPIDLCLQFHFATYISEFIQYAATIPDFDFAIKYLTSETNIIEYRKTASVEMAKIFFSDLNYWSTKRSGFGHTITTQKTSEKTFELIVWQYPLRVTSDTNEYSADFEEYSLDFKVCKILFKLLILDLYTNPLFLILIENIEDAERTLKVVSTDETLSVAEWMLNLAVSIQRSVVPNGTIAVAQSSLLPVSQNSPY